MNRCPRPPIGPYPPTVTQAIGPAGLILIIDSRDDHREGPRTHAMGTADLGIRRGNRGVGARPPMMTIAGQCTQPAPTELESSCGKNRAAVARAIPGQTGFTLVEAMVALVVLSVGLIGVAALHGQSLSAARTAYFRSIAVTLSADMADRIRGNRLAGAAYAGSAASYGCDPSNGGGVDCSPTEMAAHDLYVWDGMVESSLPNGRSTVRFDGGTSPPTYTITVMWDEVGAPVNPVQHQIALQLPPY